MGLFFTSSLFTIHSSLKTLRFSMQDIYSARPPDLSFRANECESRNLPIWILLCRYSVRRFLHALRLVGMTCFFVTWFDRSLPLRFRDISDRPGGRSLRWGWDDVGIVPYGDGIGRPQGSPLRGIPWDFGTGNPSPTFLNPNFKSMISRADDIRPYIGWCKCRGGKLPPKSAIPLYLSKYPKIPLGIVHSAFLRGRQRYVKILTESFI